MPRRHLEVRIQASPGVEPRADMLHLFFTVLRLCEQPHRASLTRPHGLQGLEALYAGASYTLKEDEELIRKSCGELISEAVLVTVSL